MCEKVHHLGRLATATLVGPITCHYLSLMGLINYIITGVSPTQNSNLNGNANYVTVHSKANASLASKTLAQTS